MTTMTNAADAQAVLQAIKQFSKFTKLVENINTSQSTWKADTDPTFDYDATRNKLRASLIFDDTLFPIVQSVGPSPIVSSSPEELPVNFVAGTNKWTECAQTINTVPDQGYCGSCWAVASASTMTDRLCISTGGQDKRIISAQDLLECCPDCGFQCNGGSIVSAYNYWMNTGIVSGGSYMTSGVCKSYGFAPCSNPVWRTSDLCTKRNTDVKCRRTCQASYSRNYPSDQIKGKMAYRISGGEETMKREIFLNGSITAAMMVYEDFMVYKTGVYQKGESNKSNQQLGGHAIRIIGWGVTSEGVKFWLCVNSWGLNWGERGRFKILRGVNHVLIEEYAMAGTYN
jgi:cathepsin B